MSYTIQVLGALTSIRKYQMYDKTEWGITH